MPKATVDLLTWANENVDMIYRTSNESPAHYSDPIKHKEHFIAFRGGRKGFGETIVEAIIDLKSKMG